MYVGQTVISSLRCHENGVRTTCRYEFVINARIGVFALDEAVLEVMSLCAKCPNPYEVYESSGGLASNYSTQQWGYRPGVLT